MIWAFFYCLSIVTANVLTASMDPAAVGKLIIPAGSWLIGLTFILRDLTQDKIGRKNIYMVILLALLLSAAVSGMLGDSLRVVLASSITFLVAELTDTEIYSRLKSSWLKRVVISGVVGGLLDSVLFVVLALSPLFNGPLSWELTAWGILGQFIVKSSLQFVFAGIIKGGKNLARLHG